MAIKTTSPKLEAAANAAKLPRFKKPTNEPTSASSVNPVNTPPAAPHILINMILDQSGSMASIRQDTIEGVNTYITELLKDVAQDYRLSLTLFDTSSQTRFTAAPLSTVPLLGTTFNNYTPNGGTALYDAIAGTVRLVESQHLANPLAVPTKVLTVILTDGQENSSRYTRLNNVKELIERKEAEGNWTFVFLGADLNAFAVGDSFGVSRRNSVAYDAQNMQQTILTTACATMNFAADTDNLQSGSFYSYVPEKQVRGARMQRRDPLATETTTTTTTTTK